MAWPAPVPRARVQAACPLTDEVKSCLLIEKICVDCVKDPLFTPCHKARTARASQRLARVCVRTAAWLRPTLLPNMGRIGRQQRESRVESDVVVDELRQRCLGHGAQHRLDRLAVLEQH